MRAAAIILTGISESAVHEPVNERVGCVATIGRMIKE
jgi:hypothetical protein